MKSNYLIILMRFIACLFVSCLTPLSLLAEDSEVDPGQITFREPIQEQHENIDPYTGRLSLVYKDLTFQGDGGLDLEIVRTYISSRALLYQPQKTSLGHGWDINFGYIKINSGSIDLELHDGTKSTAYPETSGAFFDPITRFITKDYWKIYAPGSGEKILTFSDGRRIIFGKLSSNGKYYATRIEKGKSAIIITYGNHGGIDHSVETVSFSNSGVLKTIKFEYIPNSRLITSIVWGVTGSEKRIAYTYTGDGKELESVNFPAGDKWRYSYVLKSINLANSSNILRTVYTPHGGTYSYDFDHFRKPSSDPFSQLYQLSVSEKIVNDGIRTYTSKYNYKGIINDADYTTITDSDGRTEEYKFIGQSNVTPGECYKYGLQKSKKITDQGLQELTEYTWDKMHNQISNARFTVGTTCEDSNTYVPVKTISKINSNGTVHTTTYNNYDEYANPQTIVETGTATRTTSQIFWKNTSSNMVKGFPEKITVTGDSVFPGTFVTQYAYYESGSTLGNIKQSNKFGVMTNYAYDVNANLSSVQNANGNTTSYGWSNGAVSQINNGVYTINRVINWDGTVQSEKNGRGFTTSYAYDNNMRLLKITPPAGNPTTIQYLYSSGSLIGKTQTRGSFTGTTSYDGTGRPWRTTNSLGVDNRTFFRASGEIDHTTSNIGDSVFYDGLGRMSSVVHQDGTKLTYQYTNDHQYKIVDEAGYSTAFTFGYFGDPKEKFIKVYLDAQNQFSYYNYNVLGSLTAVTKGAYTRSFQYDTKNFLVSESHPESGTTSYPLRDNIGNLKQKVENGKTVNYTYDSVNRLTAKASGAYYQNFAYDWNDNIVTATSPNVAISYAYDAADRATGISSNIRGVARGMNYAYDGNDNITQITYPSGTIVNYAYNGLNQVTGISGFGGQLTNISYFTTAPQIGLLQSYTRQNGQTVSFTWDKRRQVYSSGPAQGPLTFRYDARGNLNQYSQAGKSQSYGYDQLNRITSFNGSWGSGVNTYDPADNLTKMTIGSAATTYTFDAPSNRLVKENTTTYGYDGANVTSIGTLNLAYDPFDNMLSAKENTAPLGAYEYDAFNKRVRKEANGQITHYYYGKTENVLSEITEAGQLLYDYVYLDNTLVARVDHVSPDDADGDGLRYDDEVSVYRTNPDLADTDSDGIQDGAEVAYWGARWNQDTDGDGLKNIIDADSDNDRYLDGEEINRGSNPADGSSIPITLTPVYELLLLRSE